MLEIKYEVNGKPVSLENLQDALMAAVLVSVKNHVIETIGSATCPEHGGSPNITIVGNSLEDVSFNVSGCCQGLIDEVKRKFEE